VLHIHNKYRWFIFLKIVALTLFLLYAFLLGLFACIGNRFFVDFSALEQYQAGRPSVVLDKDGNQWCTFQLDRRNPVALTKISPLVINAFIAAEDWNFFQHSGISLRAIVRSMLVNLCSGKIVQGASTITQQLVKLLFFDSSRTFKRKVKEQLYALLVERQFTKQQILETYLNHVYFGCGIYGVEAAAQRFFNCSICDVTIEQAAVLAATVRSPGNYCPLLFPFSAFERRNVILNQMAKRGFIDTATCKAVKQKSLLLAKQEQSFSALHFKETVRKQLEEMFAKQELYAGGLTIKTTLDKSAQMKAEKAFKDHCNKLKKEIGKAIDGALMSIDVKTGAVKALIGGYSFEESPFNRATQAYRQQGSVFKPILYAAGLLEGFSLLDTAVDEPLTVKQGNQLWQPKNYNKQYEGSMTLARALSYSNNIISAKLILAIGPQKVAHFAEKFHFKGPILPYPALSLGCVDSTVLEVVGAFNVFANDGIYVKPYVIEWVKDVSGQKIYRHIIKSEILIKRSVVHQIAQVLSLGLERKRDHEKEWIDSAAINKTGTTNDSRTCWFAGSTPEVTTVVYIGFDDNSPMGQAIFPVYTAYPIWLNYHKGVKTKKKEFDFDPSLTPMLFNIKTGKRAFDHSCEDVFTLLV
jgi:penicillin-binding protein 1A